MGRKRKRGNTFHICEEITDFSVELLLHVVGNKKNKD